ncbi:hypothetical protein CSA37_03460 [Candidatus Fermentibacteria bacterium]|nr:MAG: hypothetical protein CSA37_03460 [Candidatus Fermentibacteria bacterium]
MKKMWLFRAASGAGAAGALLISYALLTSCSVNETVLGRWSVLLAVMTVAFILLAGVFIVTAAGFRGAYRPLSGYLRRLPDITGPLLSVILLAVAFSFWFLEVSPLFSRMSFFSGVFLVSLVPGFMCIFSRTGSELSSVITGGLVMLISLILAVAVFEVLLRQIMPEHIFNPRFGLRPCARYELEVDLPGITPGGVLSTNIWGFRGEDPPENWNEMLTIVTVGGSTTANYYLDDSRTWSHVMQQELRKTFSDTWVGNAGIPRHSTDTHLLLIREVMPEINPDVIVFLVGVNDMAPFLRPDGGENRLPDSGPREWLFRNSSVVQMLYRAKKVYLDGVPVVSTAVDPEFREVPMTEPEERLPDDLHDLLEDPGFYRERIRRLIRECRSQGIEPVFFTQPLLYENTEYWQGIEECARFFSGTSQPLSAASFSLMLETLNDDLVQVCTEEHAAVFDLASEIPHSRDMFYDAMHMTEQGAALVGRTAAGYLTSYFMEAGIPWQED